MRARAQTRPKTPVASPQARTRRSDQGAAPSPAPKLGKPRIRIFVSYSHVDKEARRKFKTHFAPLKTDNLATWFDRDMDAGDKLDTAIALASHYCWKIEYRRAMNRRARGTMQVVAVVVRPCNWKSTPAARFKLLPEDGRTLQEWRSVDAALVEVVRGIRRFLISVRKGQAEAKPKRRTAATDGGRSASPVKKTGARPALRKAWRPAADPRVANLPSVNPCGDVRDADRHKAAAPKVHDGLSQGIESNHAPFTRASAPATRKAFAVSQDWRSKIR